MNKPHPHPRVDSAVAGAFINQQPKCHLTLPQMGRKREKEGEGRLARQIPGTRRWRGTCINAAFALIIRCFVSFLESYLFSPFFLKIHCSKVVIAS